MTKFFFLVFTFSLFLCSCSSQTEQKKIRKIFKEDDVRKAGKLLQSLPMGLTLLNATNNQADTVFVAVHGYASEGYEWIKPLQKIMQKGFQLYYYRWDWNTCPDYAERKLLVILEDLIINKSQIDHLNIVGHSYGGTLVAGLADETTAVTMSIHTVAAPMMPYERLINRCANFNGYENMTISNDLFQWRTVKEEDGAFKNMAVDPQIANIPNSTVIELPPQFQDGRRLGHNWSISWVIDNIFED